MFIAIIGTRFSGKSSIENYLVTTKGFKSVRIVSDNGNDVIEEFEVGDYPTLRGDLADSLLIRPQIHGDLYPLTRHFLSIYRLT